MSDYHEAESSPLLGNSSKGSKSKSKKSANRKRKRKSAFKGPSSSGAPENSHADFHDSKDHHMSSANDFDKTDSWGILHEGTDEETSNTRDSSDANLSSHFPHSYFDHRPSIAVMEAINSSGTIRRGRKSSMSRANRSGSIGNSDQHSSNKRPASSGLPRMTTQEAERWAKANSRPPRKHHEKHDARSRGDDVVIDVDALMDHVKRSNRSQSSANSSSLHNSEGGYNSRPSSRRSSNSSSINDVCLPLDDEDIAGTKVWPDVAVLEEYSKEETERLRNQAVQDAENFHFQYDDEDDYDEDSQNNDGVLFSKPIVTNIDVPELGNTRINEAEHLKAGRLRPKKITPWHLRRKANNIPGFTGQTDAKNVTLVTNNDQKQKDDYLVGNRVQYPPHIVSNNPEHFRFTYFREDLDSTIHSPTISGLLQPGQKFEDLFVNSVYNNNSNSNNSNPGNTPSETKPSTPQQQTPLQKLTTTQSGSVDMFECEPFWMDVSNPTEEEMKVLSKAFGIHPLTTEDIFLGEVREKVELFKDYYLVCFRSFDIVAERHTRNKKTQHESGSGTSFDNESSKGWLSKLFRSRRHSSTNKTSSSSGSSFRNKVRREIEENEKYKRKSGDRRKPRGGELEPLNVYIIVFRTGVLTFHFAPTPHPINVRRRARLLKDYLNVTADWIAYALIDDITDAFAPMIEIIEDEVHDIEESILNMHQSDDSSDEDDSSDDETRDRGYTALNRYPRRGSAVDDNATFSSRSRSTRSTSSSSSLDTNIIGWKRKGDMLRRIGECRKRVMSIVRLLGSKADVIKGFSKRCNEQWEVAPRSEIGMYLGDIQDHIVTMVSSLNHYEKLLSRSHSNYLAQINIDMTKVNNDMNDVLGKITILGTVVLPMNIITGLWGMNVLVPGQDIHSLTWFTCITSSMVIFASIAYFYTKRRFGL
ncbi:LANO_0H13300g1_1 [Lachancea nothofagi CBS 11611]|uniref:LANO_0H13300g1_1 n=1 Tax=Lachancea nothofagi CBS 11611 TaxID=1266666 RepID=A0A1G4KMH1_9SACH|nr:LANO_0H13300g1_1 [Lachancea nothofagi CBS 11611]